MKKIFFSVIILFFAGCANTPAKKTISRNFISGTIATDKEETLKKALTLEANQFGAGYSAEVTLYTTPLIIAKETERGRANMDSDEKIKNEIRIKTDLFIKNNTCFLFGIHTYSPIERAMFKNWVAKVQDSKKLHEIEFINVTGVSSVPELYKDTWGREWHNFSFGCAKEKIDTEKQFTLYLIPQIKNNKDQNETTELVWIVQ